MTNLPAQMAPWERQRGESSKAYEAFCLFRDLPLGKRTVALAAEQLGKNRTGLQHWSTRWNWKDRVLAYDAYMAGLTLIERRQELEEAKKRHVAEARAVQTKAMMALKTLPIEEMKPADILAWTERAIEIERRALGEPTQVTKQEVFHHHQVEPPKAETEEEEMSRMMAVVVELQKLGVLNINEQLEAKYANVIDLTVRESEGTAEAPVDEVHTDNPDREADGVPAARPHS